MTAQQFITWVQVAYGCKNKTGAVEKAADLLGVTPQAVWRWLNGKRTPGAATARLMAALMQ